MAPAGLLLRGRWHSLVTGSEPYRELEAPNKREQPGGVCETLSEMRSVLEALWNYS